MTHPNVPAESLSGELVVKAASDLSQGDVLVPRMLPWSRRLTQVIFTDTYELHGEHRTIVVYKDEDGHRDSTNFRADAAITLLHAAEPTGRTYGRGDEAQDGRCLGSATDAQGECGHRGIHPPHLIAQA